MFIVKRDGTKVPFDKDKIIRAINGAMVEVDGKVYEYDTAKDIANDIEQELENKSIIGVEEIQDMVEDYLMRSERRDVARAYIRFRYKKEVACGVKDDFIKAVWTERLREFPLEFKIWDDCVRTGMFPVVDATEKGKVTYVTLVGAKNGSGGTFQASDLLWPLSLNEIQRNPNLVQNDGYK